MFLLRFFSRATVDVPLFTLASDLLVFVKQYNGPSEGNFFVRTIARVNRSIQLTIHSHCHLIPGDIIFRFLWGTYRPSVYWYECWECVRKLLLTGLLVYFKEGTPTQVNFQSTHADWYCTQGWKVGALAVLAAIRQVPSLSITRRTCFCHIRCPVHHAMHMFLSYSSVVHAVPVNTLLL